MKNISLKKIAVCGSLLMSSVGFNYSMEPKQEQQINNVNLPTNIKSIFILKKIFDNVLIKKKLNIIKYNKKIQEKLNIYLKNYRGYCTICVDIEMCKQEKLDNILEGLYNFIKNLNSNFNFWYEIITENNITTKNSLLTITKNKIAELIGSTSSFRLNIILGPNSNSLDGLFENCSFIKEIKFEKFINDKIRDMKFMFYKCSNLNKLNLSSFNTKNVTNMSYMFSGCSSLVSLNLSSFNTKNVKNMKYMFSGCSSLVSLNLSSFNTENVTDMVKMFLECYSLVSLNLSNFKTENVTDMSNMFFDCRNIKIPTKFLNK